MVVVLILVLPQILYLKRVQAKTEASNSRAWVAVTLGDNTSGGGVSAWGSILTCALTEQGSNLTARDWKIAHEMVWPFPVLEPKSLAQNFTQTINSANRSFQSYTQFLKHAYGSNCSPYQIVHNAKNLTPQEITIEHTLQRESTM